MTQSDELLEKFRKRFDYSTGVEIPPRVFLDMEGEFTAYDEQEQRLTARFPVLERYHNPLGVMQGGMIAAAIDNVLGPLSYLAAAPSVTTQLNISFIKAVERGTEYIEVTARVDEHTRRFLFMSARVCDPQGDVLALAQASFMILRIPRSQS